MTIQLKPEQEQIVGQAIQAGLFANADDIVDVAIDAIRQCLRSPSNEANTPILSARDWEREFDTSIESFPDTAPLPDEALSRENLYPDRL
jgi:Arc/MetJ-type ribon-helix-helix transcriptional regulator